MLEGVDTVIFGGWLCGGAVIGAGALCAHPDWFRGRRLIAFVTGSGEYDGTSRFGDVIQDNFSALCPERVFYLKGDLCYRKMRWYHKFLINFMIVEDNKGERRKLRAAQCRWEESQADRLMDYMKS